MRIPENPVSQQRKMRADLRCAVERAAHVVRVRVPMLVEARELPPTERVEGQHPCLRSGAKYVVTGVGCCVLTTSFVQASMPPRKMYSRPSARTVIAPSPGLFSDRGTCTSAKSEALRASAISRPGFLSLIQAARSRGSRERVAYGAPANAVSSAAAIRIGRRIAIANAKMIAATTTPYETCSSSGSVHAPCGV